MQNQSKLSRNRSWTMEEDDKLRQQMNAPVKPNWETVSKESGLERSANSCRLRWINHLKPGARPDRKLTDEEKLLILQSRFEEGKNRWSKIAKNLLSGRRDNDVKNYWHSLAKRAKREGHDVELHAFLERGELMDKIRAAGKFTMDYSSLIRPAAFNKLIELFPDLAVAEIAPCAVSSPSYLGTSGDLASSSAAAAVTSSYSVEFGPGRAGEVDQEQILGIFNLVQAAESGGTATEIDNNPYQQLVNSGWVDHGGGSTGFNQVQAAAFNGTETGNQGKHQMQDSAPPWNPFVDAPGEFHGSAQQQQQQLGFNSEDLYLGGGAAEFNQATAAAFHRFNYY